MKNPNLWQKIQQFKFDKPNIKLTFQKRLANENYFTQSFASQVVNEYKKFIYLCCVSEQQITPSHFVDLAWHLHLTYTKSYWLDLCEQTIERQLHHNPTEGGNTENQKFRNLYADTLRLYEQEFGQQPPANIWQESEARFKNRIANIDRSKFWLVNKPNLRIKKLWALVGVLASAGLLWGCTQSGGELFGIFIFIFFVGAIIVGLVIRGSEASSDAESRNRNADAGGCGGGGCGGGIIDGGGGDAGGGDGGGGCSSGCGGGCGGGGCGGGCGGG